MNSRRDAPTISFNDTATLPTPEMLAAITGAELGDDVYHDDPTVNELEDRSAELLGKEAAIFMPSGTMANLVAILTHCRPGDEVMLEADAHILYYESGGVAAIAGVMPQPVPGDRGVLSPAAVERKLRGADDHFPKTTLLCVENTHNRAGGTVTDATTMRELGELCASHGLRMHLDGARIFNAALALDTDVRELVAPADSVMFCLSKGLGAPAGSMLLGTEAFVTEARRQRKRLGGAMRQAGLLAAAGLVALDAGRARLAEDHARARRLGEMLAGIDGLAVDLAAIETNIVLATVDPARTTPDHLVEALRQHGIKASDRPPDAVRFVTHRGIGDAQLVRLVDVLAAILTRRASDPVSTTIARTE